MDQPNEDDPGVHRNAEKELRIPARFFGPRMNDPKVEVFIPPHDMGWIYGQRSPETSMQNSDQKKQILADLAAGKISHVEAGGKLRAIEEAIAAANEANEAKLEAVRAVKVAANAALGLKSCKRCYGPCTPRDEERAEEASVTWRNKTSDWGYRFGENEVLQLLCASCRLEILDVLMSREKYSRGCLGVIAVAVVAFGLFLRQFA